MPTNTRSDAAWAERQVDYAYPRSLGGCGWAWEFLRRNPGYIEAASRVRDGPRITHFSGTHIRVSCLPRPDPDASPWGLRALIPPLASAGDVSAFWLTDHLRGTLFCTARHVAEGPFALTSLTAEASIVQCNSHEYLCIRHGSQTLRLVNDGQSLLDGPCHLDRLGTSAYPAYAPLIASLKLLRQLSHPTRQTPQPTLKPDLGLMHALIALEGHLAGASHRDIAIVIRGHERVRDEWRGGQSWLQSAVRRAIDRGLALMSGGYRTLL